MFYIPATEPDYFRMRLALARALFVKVISFGNLMQIVTIFCLSLTCYCLMNLPIIVGRFLYEQRFNIEKIVSVDLNALAWLEDYLQTWPGTILVV